MVVIWQGYILYYQSEQFWANNIPPGEERFRIPATRHSFYICLFGVERGRKFSFSFPLLKRTHDRWLFSKNAAQENAQERSRSSLETGCPRNPGYEFQAKWRKKLNLLAMKMCQNWGNAGKMGEVRFILLIITWFIHCMKDS